MQGAVCRLKKSVHRGRRVRRVDGGREGGCWFLTASWFLLLLGGLTANLLPPAE